MVRGDISKNLFLNTQYKQRQPVAPIILPGQPFSADHGERMAITLSQFSLNKNFPAVNASNHSFYLYHQSVYTRSGLPGTFHEIIIPDGYYFSVASLAAQFNGAYNLSAVTTESFNAGVGFGNPKEFYALDFTTVTDLGYKLTDADGGATNNSFKAGALITIAANGVQVIYRATTDANSQTTYVQCNCDYVSHTPISYRFICNYGSFDAPGCTPGFISLTLPGQGSTRNSGNANFKLTDRLSVSTPDRDSVILQTVRSGDLVKLTAPLNGDSAGMTITYVVTGDTVSTVGPFGSLPPANNASVWIMKFRNEANNYVTNQQYDVEDELEDFTTAKQLIFNKNYNDSSNTNVYTNVPGGYKIGDLFAVTQQTATGSVQVFYRALTDQDDARTNSQYFYEPWVVFDHVDPADAPLDSFNIDPTTESSPTFRALEYEITGCDMSTDGTRLTIDVEYESVFPSDAPVNALEQSSGSPGNASSFNWVVNVVSNNPEVAFSSYTETVAAVTVQESTNPALASLATVASKIEFQDDLKGGLNIDVTPVSGNERDIYDLFCFHIRNSELNDQVPASLKANGTFGTYSDSYMLLGANPINSLSSNPGFPSKTNLNTSFKYEKLTSSGTGNGLSGTTFHFSSRYPCQLQTMDAVYLRMYSVESGNWSTPNLDDNAQRTGRVIESNIFARIPVGNTSDRRITFTDNGNDQFQTFIKRSQLESVDIAMCDQCGRNLFNVFEQQAEHAQFGAIIVLRWDLFESKEKHPEARAMMKDIAQPPLFVTEQ